MGLLIQEVDELRTLLQLVIRKKISHEDLMDRIAVYSQISKRTNQLLQAAGLAMKNGKLLGRLMKMNLLGTDEAIDLGISPRLEKVICPVEDEKLITREECVDISGKAENYDACLECGNAAVSKDLLLT